jgi:hypothetical protein
MLSWLPLEASSISAPRRTARRRPALRSSALAAASALNSPSECPASAIGRSNDGRASQTGALGDPREGVLADERDALREQLRIGMLEAIAQITRVASLTWKESRCETRSAAA